MATFRVSFVKKTAKGNFIASFDKVGSGKFLGMKRLYKAWCDATTIPGDILEAPDSEFVPETFEGTDGTEITCYWYSPA